MTTRRISNLIRCAAAAAVVSAATLVADSPATAAQAGQMSVHGTWSTTGGTVIDQRQIGQLTYLRQQGTSVFAGDLVGTTTFDLRVLLRPDFSSFGWATETFKGTFAGRTGSLVMLEYATSATDGSARIDAVVVGGAGQLSGIRGHITFVSPLCVPESCEGTYAGSLRG